MTMMKALSCARFSILGVIRLFVAKSTYLLFLK